MWPVIQIIHDSSCLVVDFSSTCQSHISFLVNLIRFISMSSMHIHSYIGIIACCSAVSHMEYYLLFLQSLLNFLQTVSKKSVVGFLITKSPRIYFSFFDYSEVLLMLLTTFDMLLSMFAKNYQDIIMLSGGTVVQRVERWTCDQ